jgi:hypothetical protein
MRPEIVLAGKDDSKAAFASVSRSIDGLTGKVGGLAARFGGVTAVVAGIAGAFATVENLQALKILDQLDDLSEKTGITVERLSELRFAGEAVGTPLEAIATGVGRLSKQMAEAAGGNKEAIETFKTLGVEVKNADGTLRGSDQVLGDIADRFRSYEDGAAKAALAQRIFGKSGADMIPLLNQGRDGIERLRREAEQLGAIYGGDLAKDAATLNDNITKLRLSSEAAAIALGGPFIKSLVRITEQMIEAKKEAGLLNAILVTIGGGFARTLGIDEVGAAQRRADDATSEMRRIQGLMDGVQLQLQRDPQNEMAQRRLETYRSKIEALQKTAAAASEELKGLANAADPASDPNRRREDRGFIPDLSAGRTAAPVAAGGGGGKEKKPKDLEADAKRYVESLTKEKERVEDLSRVEVALAEIQRIRREGGVVTEEEKQKILREAAQIDILKERTETEKKATQDREEAQRRVFALQDDAKRVFEETRTPLEAYNAELEHLNELYQANYISASTFFRASDKAATEYQEAQKKLGGDLDSFGRRAAENIQDQLGEGLASALEGNFQDIGDSFKKMLIRMAAEAAAADITRSLFGDLVKGGSGTGLLGGLFGSGSTGGASGSTTGDLFGSIASSFGGWLSGLMKFDTGTDYVPRDMVAVIHKGEKIIPAAQNRPGAGQNVIIQLTQNVGDIVTASMLRDSNESTKRQIAAALERSRRYGGAAAS